MKKEPEEPTPKQKETREKKLEDRENSRLKEKRK